MDLWEIFPFTPEVGYLGLAVVSFFGSLVPFVPIPSFVLLVTMSVGTQFDIHLLAIIAAFTATAAKKVIFYISYGGRRIISEKTKKRMKPFQKLVKRYGGTAAFVAAATPIHYMGLSILEPILADIDDPAPVYIGIIIFAVAMTVVVVLVLRLDWERILGRIAPWTLDDENNK